MGFLLLIIEPLLHHYFTKYYVTGLQLIITPLNMTILNILSGSESLYHKQFRRYSSLKSRKKGCGLFRHFCSGFTTSHSSHVIPWGQITLNQLRYPLLNESAYKLKLGPLLTHELQVSCGYLLNI